jgi:DNA processing protein
MAGLLRPEVAEGGFSTLTEVDRLKLALAASRQGRALAVANEVRRRGLVVFESFEDALDRDARAQIAEVAERLMAAGISAVLLGSSGYPPQLASLRWAPPVLYLQGAGELLTGVGIGMCGSRAATDEGLRAARACGEEAARKGLVVVSGYARGVDMAVHTSALERGGTTIMVLAEGIRRFRVKQGEFKRLWDPSRCLIVSQFSPDQPWSAGNAMSRNGVIIGLSRALVVVEAGEKGGTLSAGLQALNASRKVYALSFHGAPLGNAELLRKGAVPIRSRTEIAERLSDLHGFGHEEQTLV